MNNNTKLIVICGLPGSGKTTLAKKLAKELNAVRFCPDEWMQDLEISLWDAKFRDKLEKLLWLQGQELLQKDINVILEYGFWAKEERDEKLTIAHKLKVSIDLYYMDTSLEILKQRLSKRKMEGDDILVDKVDEYINEIQVPDLSETKQYDNYYQLKA